MKNVKINLSFSPQKKYTLHLGNCEWLSHKNKKEAEKLLTTYKNVLRDNLQVLSNIQSQITSLYWDQHLFLDGQTETEVSYELQIFQDRYTRIFSSFSSGNQNAFVFQNIDTCFYSQQTTLHILLEYAQKYKSFPLKHKVQSLLKNHALLQAQYNQDKSTFYPSIHYRKSTRIIKLKKIKQ